MMRHFILTRFNLWLWGKDKKGKNIDRDAWLNDRVSLFECYTLPSLSAQTCKDYVWIILVDSESPEWFRKKTREWKVTCPQMHFVVVKPSYHSYFAKVFQEVVNMVVKKEKGAAEEDMTVLTTYLDNDDAVRTNFVEDIQKQAENTDSDTFLYYDYGLQYFTEMGISTRVFYPNNHFTTLVERIAHGGVNKNVRTCYGYGSHFLVERKKLAKVRHVSSKNKPMWVEIVHGCNVDNDVKMTFDTMLWLRDNDSYGCRLLQNNHRRYAYIRKWIPQMIGQVVRRAKNKLHNY